MHGHLNVKFIHQSYGTPACSEASHNFCLQTHLFCMVSFQLRHQRSLAASSFTPSSHLNLCLPTGQLPVNSAFRACFGYMVKKESLYVSSPFQFLEFIAGYYTKRAHGGAVDWGTALQARRSQVQFSMVSLEFFLDIVLLAALGPWGWLSL